MRKIHAVLVVSSILLSQQVMADAGTMSNGSPCKMIAKACIAAGYTHNETGEKRMWEDCMKPILMGQTVASVKIDTATVQACQVDKVQELKQELDDLQKVMAAQPAAAQAGQ